MRCPLRDELGKALTPGDIHIWLPAGFSGLITAHTANENVKLSPELDRHAMLRTARNDLQQGREGQVTQEWRVRMPPFPQSSRSSSREGRDSVIVYASSRSARVHFYIGTNPEDMRPSERDECVTM